MSTKYDAMWGGGLSAFVPEFHPCHHFLFFSRRVMYWPLPIHGGTHKFGFPHRTNPGGRIPPPRPTPRAYIMPLSSRVPARTCCPLGLRPASPGSSIAPANLSAPGSGGSKRGGAAAGGAATGDVGRPPRQSSVAHEWIGMLFTDSSDICILFMLLFGICTHTIISPVPLVFKIVSGSLRCPAVSIKYRIKCRWFGISCKLFSPLRTQPHANT